MYSNYREFLTDKVSEKELQPLQLDWESWWIKKSTDRLKKVTAENKLQKEILFHESITESEIENWLSVRGIN